jgi:hypothetical protein
MGARSSQPVTAFTERCDGHALTYVVRFEDALGRVGLAAPVVDFVGDEPPATLDVRGGRGGVFFQVRAASTAPGTLTFAVGPITRAIPVDCPRGTAPAAPREDAGP